MSLTFIVALLNLASGIFTRKFTSKKISTWGDSQKFIGNITYLVCFLLTEKKILSTEIRKAGVMIQLTTILYLNIYFRMSITLSIIFYSFEHRSYSTAKRVV